MENNNKKNNNRNSQNKNKINVYLICEGTSCEFVEKSLKKSVRSNSSMLCDFGMIESHYFKKNEKNTELLNKNNSIYLSSSKGSCIDTSLIVFSYDEDKKLYPIPYTTNSHYVKSKSELRMLHDVFGNNNDVNNYMTQNKFNSISEYLPSNNVKLDWTFTTMSPVASTSIGDFSKIDVKKFFELLFHLRNGGIENVFLVCGADFIVAMMNNTVSNKYTTRDMIEHTSIWNFKVQMKKSMFGTSYSVISRNKLYPLLRNKGVLESFDKLFFYIYQDAKIPIFHYNRYISSTYLKKDYLRICPKSITYGLQPVRKPNKQERISNNHQKPINQVKGIKKLINLLKER
jgi:hypothetical protein